MNSKLMVVPEYNYHTLKSTSLPAPLIPCSVASTRSTHTLQRTSSPPDSVVVPEVAAARSLSQWRIGVTVDTHASSIALGDDRLTRTLVTRLERRRVIRRWLRGRQLRVAADVVLWRGKSGCGGAPRQTMARFATWLWFVSKVVRVILAAVVRVRVCFEASVDQCCGRVEVYFANLRPPRRQGALTRLSADVTDRSCEEWVDELGVVLIHDFAVNESRVLRLLHERCLHKAQLKR